MSQIGETSAPFPGSTTLVLRPPATDSGTVIHLKLKKPKNDRKKVSFDEHTVDNEHMNKKKSKCCCIYTKPKKFGDPDEDECSENDDNECNSCMGSKKTHFLPRPEGQTEEPKEVCNS